MLATQTLIQKKSKNMQVLVDGRLAPGATAKDIILAVIGEIGTAGGTGYAIEYAGEAVRALSMEGRMTVCNMSIEGGAACRHDRARREDLRLSQGPAEIAQGRGLGRGDALLGDAALGSQAQFDAVVKLDAAKLPPLVTWGTSPEQVTSITGHVPVPAEIADEHKRKAAETALAYMGLKRR